MAKIETLKNDLRSMRDLQDLTNVLEQVAARDIAQMRKSIVEGRPFFQEVWRIYRILSELTPPSPEVVHKHLIVVIALDWGMPGDLLNRVQERAESLYEEHGADMLIAGKMAHARFRGKTERTIHFFGAPKKMTLSEAQPIHAVIAGYARVSYVYPRLISLSRQEVITKSVSVKDSATSASEGDNLEDTEDSIAIRRFLIEPSPQEISNYMNRAVVGLTVQHYFLEALLAYSAAQMVAMRNAYDNAKEETKMLSIRYNKARRELVDTKLRELYGSHPSSLGEAL